MRTWATGWALGAAALGLSGSVQAAPQTCEASLERHAFAIPGGARPPMAAQPSTSGSGYAEVQGDHRFLQVLPTGWVFALVPQPHGWSIRLFDSEPIARAVDLSAVTPPYHLDTNPRELSGWHFRNAANTGPNEGDVNAPQAWRSFFFSLPRAREEGAANSPAPTASVSAGSIAPDPHAGRGWLRVLDHGLADLAAGQRARLNYLRFEACLSWPRSEQEQQILAERQQRAIDDADPRYRAEELETFGSCGLDLARFELDARVLPRILAGDLDGDGAFDEVAQIRRRRDGRYGLALCRAGTWLHLLGFESQRDVSPKGDVRALASVASSLEAWQLVSSDHGSFGYEGEPAWPVPAGDVLVLDRIEKHRVIVYWHSGQLEARTLYRYVEP